MEKKPSLCESDGGVGAGGGRRRGGINVVKKRITLLKLYAGLSNCSFFANVNE